MLLNDSRRDARMRDGQLVLLDEQDRSLWDWQQIAEGPPAARSARSPSAAPAPTLLQAAIADLHLQRAP